MMNSLRNYNADQTAFTSGFVILQPRTVTVKITFNSVNNETIILINYLILMLGMPASGCNLRI